jgi:site-specific DNA recombinase
MIDQKLAESIARAHAWLGDLYNGRHASIDDLAAATDLHPKVVRQGLRLAGVSTTGPREGRTRRGSDH